MRSPRARELRRNSTDAEAKLWYALRNRQIGGAKFRRRHPIGPYFADFACPERGIVIELDGGQHATMDETTRTRRIEAEGYRILRFWNTDVLQNFDGVLAIINEALTNTPSPRPSPPRGRGRTGRASWPSLSPLVRGSEGEGRLLQDR